MKLEKATIVFPALNEAQRMDRARFLEMAKGPLHLLLVDDGSTDATLELMHDIARAAGPKVSVLGLPVNVGKAEAVRVGMRQAMDDGSTIVGYADSDLATPPREIERLVRTLTDTQVAMAMGSRVARAGARIDRVHFRHLTGRVFATAAAQILRAPFYDTQCGAKALRVTPELASALSTPFLTRWAFDVELIGRLLAGAPGVKPLALEDFLELPLDEWTDVKGSKVSLAAMARVLVDLGRVELDISARRKRAQG